MKKENKTLIRVLITILVILIILVCINIIIIFKNVIKINSVKGIYHSDNWNNKEATLTLNKDFTCKYPSSSNECTYEITKDKVIIYLTHYTIDDSNELKTSYSSLSIYLNKDECEEQAEKDKNENSKSTATCKAVTDTHEATLTKDGLLLHDVLFTKVK